MRASDLIGQDVIAHDGRKLGIVTDLRCVQDGPLRGAMRAPRVNALIVSARHTGSLLGYDRRGQLGPWMIRAIVKRLHRHLVVVSWSDVASHAGPIILRRIDP
jgi:hypothetical protein